MSKKHIAQQFRQWAGLPRSEPVHYDEIGVQADTPEQAKAFMEEQCQQAFAGEPVGWHVEIVDGQVQVFFHGRA